MQVGVVGGLLQSCEADGDHLIRLFPGGPGGHLESVGAAVLGVQRPQVGRVHEGGVGVAGFQCQGGGVGQGGRVVRPALENRLGLGAGAGAVAARHHRQRQGDPGVDHVGVLVDNGLQHGRSGHGVGQCLGGLQGREHRQRFPGVHEDFRGRHTAGQVAQGFEGLGGLGVDGAWARRGGGTEGCERLQQGLGRIHKGLAIGIINEAVGPLRHGRFQPVLGVLGHGHGG